MRSPILLVVLWLVPLLMRGQDIRLSPKEPVIFSLPNEYRIESGDSIGDRVLVVWGTTRSSGLGSVVGELRYQMLDGGMLVGAQRILTTAGARPSGFLQVIPVDSFFLVLWNDFRKDSSGLYLRKVGVQGELLDSEIRLSPNPVDTSSSFPSIVVFGKGSEDRHLLWHDNRSDSSGIYSLHVTKGGKLDLSLVRSKKSFYTLLHFSTLPDLTLLPLSDNSSLVVRGNGTVDDREAVWPHYGDSYNLGPDTALVTLAGRNLKHYASIFAKIPDWTVDLPQLDSAVGNMGIVSRDSTGMIQVYFATVRATQESATEKITTSTIYRIDIDRPGIISPPYRLNEHRFKTGFEGNGSVAVSVSLVDSGFQQGYDNTAVVRLVWLSTQSSQSGGVWQGKGIEYLGVDSQGNFREDSTGFISGFPQSPPMIVRRDQDTLSVVVLVLPDTTIELKAPTGSINPIYPLTRPALAPLSDNDFYCVWNDQHRGLTLARLPVPYAMPASVIDRLKIDSLPEFSFNDLPGTIRSVHYDPRIQDDQMFALPDIFGYQSNDALSCSVREQYSAASYEHYTLYRYRVGIYLPSQTGWNQGIAIDESRQTTAPFVPGKEGNAFGYDPDRGEVLVLITASDGYGHSLPSSIAALDREGGKTWTLENLILPAYESILPVDSLRYLVLTDKEGILYKGTSVIDTTLLGPRGVYSRYQRLHGLFFLRTSWKSASSDTMGLELYALSTGLRDRRELCLAHHSGTTIILQRPSDSGLVVLWGTEDDGVHAALLDRNLNVVVADTVVSATRGKAINPSGVFRGDSLYIVWEDYRNGEADIYGTSFLSPSAETLDVEDRRGGDQALTLRLMPNPVTEGMRVEFNRPVESETELELFDLLGALVWQGKLPSGSASGYVPIEGAGSGTYRLRWESGDQSGSVPVVIVR